MDEERLRQRSSALDLLRAQHTFPGPYVFRLVIEPGAAPSIVSAVSAAMRHTGRMSKVEEKPSRQGRFVSLRLHVEVHRAEGVLDVYEVVSGLDGVVMSL